MNQGSSIEEVTKLIKTPFSEISIGKDIQTAYDWECGESIYNLYFTGK